MGFILFLLQVLFFLLKVTGVVGWPWPVVLIPLWFALAVVGVLLVLLIDYHEEQGRARGHRNSKW